MKDLTVSTRGISRGFTKLLRHVVKQGVEVTVTSRGKPVAVLCPYKRYRKARRQQAMERLMKLGDQYLGGLSLEETHFSSRKDLEAMG